MVGSVEVLLPACCSECVLQHRLPQLSRASKLSRERRTVAGAPLGSQVARKTPRSCHRARAHRLPRLSHSRQQVWPRLSYALKVSQPTHWIYICLEVSVLVSAQPLICHAMTFKYITIFAVNHLRAFMSESEHVMWAINEYQCCTALLH